jgi:hypothetical protein
MRFTLQRTPLSMRISLLASAGESFTPSMRTYSNVIRFLGGRGNLRHSSSRARRGYVRLTGMSMLRSSLLVALRETARLISSFSDASLLIPGTSPYTNGSNNSFVICQWFTHAHEDKVKYWAPFEISPGDYGLLDDFPCSKLPLQSHRCRLAKHASHCATHLCGEALGPMTTLGNQHGFNHQTIFQDQEPFFCSVGGHSAVQGFDMADTRVFVEKNSIALGNIGHLFKGEGLFSIYPLKNLPGAIGTETPRGEKLLHFFREQMLQQDFVSSFHDQRCFIAKRRAVHSSHWAALHLFFSQTHPVWPFSPKWQALVQPQRLGQARP